MPLSNGSCHPTASILICSRDRRSDLEQVTNELLKMNVSHLYEIVVVEETDTPLPIKGVRYFPHPIKNLGFPYTRNLSIEKAAGEILVFLDDDCRIRNGWLDALIRPFTDRSVVGVQGGVTAPDGSNAVGWAESLLGFPGGGIRRIIGSHGNVQETIEVSTLNCAYRRWVVEAVGGFSRSLKWGGEDYLLAKKACRHGKCLFVPDALVTHRTRGDLTGIWHWFVRRGRADIGVVRSREYAGTNYPYILRNSLVFKFLLLFVPSLLIPGGPAYMIPAFIITYSFVQYYRFFSTWRKSRTLFKSFLVLPLVKITMDIATDFGRLKSVFHG